MRVASFIEPGNGQQRTYTTSLHPGGELVLYGVTKKWFRTALASAAAASVARGKRRRPPATGTNARRHTPRSQRKRPREACAA
jgi:hypothetical protein